MDSRAAEFQQHRPRLYGIAYRMLGARAEAEDMVQDAYLRWHRSDIDAIQNPEAWLVTTVTRLCIDRLRVVSIEREAYKGPWLPEPIMSEAPSSPDRASELADDLSMALLVVLERLAPEERAGFLLREVFDSGYEEIAGILGKSTASCRQLVHRAQERVRRERPRFHVSAAARDSLLDRLIAAIKSADKQALIALFADDATWTADGGGKVAATSKVLRGGARIAKLLLGLGRRLEAGDRIEKVTINGETGLVLRFGGSVVTLLSIYTDGVRILAAYNVVNPDKLGAIVEARAP
jgi:RNA polymerase sigma-70 factor, ECF subfamily